VKADLNSPKKTALNLPIVLAKLDDLESSPKLFSVEYNKTDLNRFYNTNRLNFFCRIVKADLNRPKEGSVGPPTGFGQSRPTTLEILKANRRIPGNEPPSSQISNSK